MTTPLTEYLDAFDALPWHTLPDEIHDATTDIARDWYVLARQLNEYRNEPTVAAALQAQYDAEA